MLAAEVNVAPEIPPRPEPELSLAAELLLLSFDPRPASLYPARAGRLSMALGLAGAPEEHGGSVRRARLWLLGRRARGRALKELSVHGMVATGRNPQLLDRAALAARYDRLAACMGANEFPDPRDRTLILLLAWTGVLAQRLRGRDPRWFKRMIEGAVPEPDLTSPLLPPLIYTWVGAFAVAGMSADVTHHFEDHAGHDGGALDHGTSSDGYGGFDGGGNGDSGG